MIKEKYKGGECHENKIEEQEISSGSKCQTQTLEIELNYFVMHYS